MDLFWIYTSVSVLTSPPASATCWLANWLASQLQTDAYHIGISSDIVYIPCVSLARSSACISTWLHCHSFHCSSIFDLNPYSFIQKILQVGPMDTITESHDLE